MNESAKIQLHNGQYHALLNKNSRLAKKGTHTQEERTNKNLQTKILASLKKGQIHEKSVYIDNRQKAPKSRCIKIYDCQIYTV